MPDLACPLGRALAVDAFERVCHSQVIGLQSWQRKHRQHSLPHEVVSEAVLVRSRGDKKAAARGLLERISKLMPRKLAECLEQRNVEIAPHHGRRDEHPLRRLAQSLEPAADEAAHALGELEVLFREARLHACRAAEHGFRLRHVKGGLLDEKRVALRRRLDAHELHGREQCLRQPGHDPLDIAIQERAERDALGAAPAQEAGQHGAEGPCRVELRVPVGADHDHVAATDPLGQVAEEQ